MAMLGIKGVTYDAQSVSFKFPNRRGPNYCKITLGQDDTSTMIFGRIRKHVLTRRHQLDGVYWDDLIRSFEITTGLRLSL